MPDRVRAYLQNFEDGAEWADAAPGIAAEFLDKWHLQPGRPYENSMVSLVVPVARSDGSEAVLKVQYPHRESNAEARALQLWDGNGAVQLIDHDAERSVLLIEKCTPGEPLSGVEGEIALTVICELLPRLWLPEPTGVGAIDEEADFWSSSLNEHFDRGTLGFSATMAQRATDLMAELIASQADQVLVHQDLHGENIISAEREPWLVIDPKPLSAERAFGVAPVISSPEFGHSKNHVARRVDRVVDELGVDRSRAVSWAFARTVAWAQDGFLVHPKHVETAEWLAEML